MLINALLIIIGIVVMGIVGGVYGDKGLAGLLIGVVVVMGITQCTS
jgi:hypothetical protein|tara:strand:+ start:376 stop:513 length:138 start_codon:yes stop_codon:yes gene_type:complete